MKGNQWKRMLAALCAAALLAHAGAALAEQTPSEPLVQAVTPEQGSGQTQETETAPQVKQFSLAASYGEGTLCVTVKGASAQAVLVKLYDESDARVGSQTMSQGTGTAYFNGLPSGTYTAVAVYEDEAAQAQVKSASVTETILTAEDAAKLAEEALKQQESQTPPTTETVTPPTGSTENPPADTQTGSSSGATAITPSGGATAITPSGGATAITPSGGATAITPSGGATAITPSGGATQTGGDTKPTPKLEVSATASGDTITATLSGNMGITVDMALYSNDTGEMIDMKTELADTASVTFTGLAAGSYNVYAEYTQGGGDDYVDVIVPGKSSEDTTPPTTPTTPTAPEGSGTTVVVPDGSQTQTPPQETPSGQFAISVSQGKGTLTVTVTDALGQPIGVELTKPDGTTEWSTVEAGNGSASFTGLAAGVYSVYLDYMSPVSGVEAVEQTGITLAQGADVVPVVSGQFNVGAVVSGSKIAITVTDALAQAVDVVLIKPDNTTDVRELQTGNGTIEFTNLADGTYDVIVAYQAEVAGTSAVRREGLLIASAPVAAGAITATAQGGVNRVDVSVTAASKLPVGVTLLQGGAIKGTQRIEAGVGSVAFTAVPAGTYSVSVDYAPSQSGVRPYVIDGVAVTAQTAKIAITKVQLGEGKITVSGTAQPGAEIVLTTDPSSVTAVVKADASGAFSGDIVCGAGTYASVCAQYSADSQSRVIVSGPYTVQAQTTKPPLSVDTIGEQTITVIAQTTPGTIVNLGTYDYGQTLTADARGVLRFSLPHAYAKGTAVTFTVYYGANKAYSYQVVVTVVDQTAYPLLKKGSKGDAVYRLTERLAALGYPVSATSTYSDAVVAAVRLFQKANGLSVDGQAGQLTQSALYSVSAISYAQSGLYPTLVRGDKGIALIYTLQQRLKDLGYYTIRVDGIFGSGTQRAVRDFQAMNGLAVTGKADSATQQLLYSAAAKPAGSTPPTSGYAALSRSSRYDARVVTLQRRLMALGYLSGSADGYFGSKTYRAVRNFQSRNGIAVTGVADSYTQQVLYSAAAKAASGSSSSSASSVGYRLLYWGCKGDAVTKLQKALLAAGYRQVRVADGLYGQWTYDAVRAYQKDHGLAVDGVAGKNTQNSLYGTQY